MTGRFRPITVIQTTMLRCYIPIGYETIISLSVRIMAGGVCDILMEQTPLLDRL
jgi:hypothetical protein